MIAAMLCKINIECVVLFEGHYSVINVHSIEEWGLVLMFIDYDCVYILVISIILTAYINTRSRYQS